MKEDKVDNEFLSSGNIYQYLFIYFYKQFFSSISMYLNYFLNNSEMNKSIFVYYSLWIDDNRSQDFSYSFNNIHTQNHVMMFENYRNLAAARHIAHESNMHHTDFKFLFRDGETNFAYRIPENMGKFLLNGLKARLPHCFTRRNTCFEDISTDELPFPSLNTFPPNFNFG